MSADRFFQSRCVACGRLIQNGLGGQRDHHCPAAFEARQARIQRWFESAVMGYPEPNYAERLAEGERMLTAVEA